LLVYDKNCVICALTHLRTEFFPSIYGKLKPSDFMTATIRHLLTVCIGSPSANFESTACDNKCSAKSWCIVKNSKKMHRPSERNLWAAHMAPKVNVGDQVTVTAAKKKRKRRQQPAEGYIFFGPFWPRRTNCQRSATERVAKCSKLLKPLMENAGIFVAASHLVFVARWRCAREPQIFGAQCERKIQNSKKIILS